MRISCPLAHRAALCLVVYLALSASAVVFAAEAGEAESVRLESYRANLLTMQEERIVGRRLAYLYEQRHALLRDAVIEARLERIKGRLEAVATLPELEIKLIRSAQPEAVSFPPGYIYITSALAGLAATDDELAAIIAHEAGHIMNHDLSRLIALALSLSLQEQAGFPTRRAIVTGKAVQFDFPSELGEARLRSEIEADKSAVGWMRLAGYDSQSLALLLERLRMRLPLQAQPERIALRERVQLLREESFLAFR